MKPKEFLQKLDEARLQQAIAAAEQRTSGEIRVLVTNCPVEDPVAAARQAFLKNRMDQTRERNAVLVFIAPASRNFAVIGDEGVHARCGQAFWDELRGVISEAFAGDRFTEGLVEVVARTGRLLGEHFPRSGDDTNELSDRILGDGDR